MAYSETNSRFSFSKPLLSRQTLPVYRPPNLCVAGLKDGEYMPRCTTDMTETVQFPSPFFTTAEPYITSQNGISASLHRKRNPMFTPAMSSTPPASSISGDYPEKLSAITNNASRCQKRKLDMSERDNNQKKVFVNEDRMSARMQQLHLDNNNMSWHPDLEQNTSWMSFGPSEEIAANATTDEFFDDETLDNEEDANGDISAATNSKSLDVASSSESILHLAPELRILSGRTKNLLPSSIVNEINKSAMQVVLWKPPGDFIKDILPPPAYQEQPTEAEMKLAVDDLSTICLDTMDLSGSETLPLGQYSNRMSEKTEEYTIESHPMLFAPLPDSADDMEL